MYMLFKNKRPVGNIKFDSYEKCRQWARKLARKQKMPETYIDNVGYVITDLSRAVWRTPTLEEYGYSIRRI